MKKMIVSDYDGTLKSDVKNLMINVDAIKRFRAQGNLFTIATGRTYESIKKQCEKYDIEYDYLICNDGLVTYDKNDKLLAAKLLYPSDILAVTLTSRGDDKVKDVHFYGLKNEVYLPENLRGLHDAHILELGIEIKRLRSIKQHIDALKKEIPYLKFDKYGNMVFVNYDYNKGLAVKELQERIEGLDSDDVITVGDNRNDLEMLQMFDGRKMLTSYPTLYGKGLKTTREVHTLIKKMCK